MANLKDLGNTHREFNLILRKRTADGPLIVRLEEKSLAGTSSIAVRSPYNLHSRQKNHAPSGSHGSDSQVGNNPCDDHIVTLDIFETLEIRQK